MNGGNALMRVAMLIVPLTLMLSGCGGPVASDLPPPPPTPDNNSSTLNLKGTWNYWMRHEIGSETSLVRGTMIVQEEFCSDGVCKLAGLILKPQVATIGTQLAFSGVVLVEQPLIRIQYYDQNTSGEILVVVVEFDLFLDNHDPERTMVGHFTIFDQSESGALNEDSQMLLASGRGKLTMAGRVTAWPMNIVDPRLR